MASRGAQVKKIIDFNNLLWKFLNSPEMMHFQKTYPNVQLNVALDAEILKISGSENHLYNVLMNLIKNSFEATNPIGQISIKTHKIINFDYISHFVEIPKGDYVLCVIEDSGTGITEEDMNHLFEPFYSRKMKSYTSGSGLGLSIVWSIIKDHSGFIDVSSLNSSWNYLFTIFSVYRRTCQFVRL